MPDFLLSLPFSFSFSEPRLVLNSQYSDLGQPSAGLQEWPPLPASLSLQLFSCPSSPVVLANVRSSKDQIFNVL